MDTVKFTLSSAAGVYAGEYGWDGNIGSFDGDDWHLIKDMSGVRPAEFGDALTAVDWDVVLSLAAILIRRAGLATVPQLRAVVASLRRLPMSDVTFEDIEVEEADDRPPASATPTGSGNGNAGSSVAEGSSLTSLPVSSVTGVHPPETPPPPTGHPGWAGDAA